ncbi:SusC/RagA family TonB-linked outer membrane protein [Flavitalea sp.]|nr:SusC/RagA family TonB-linked outer membrane protein [Flavitalea sp.]
MKLSLVLITVISLCSWTNVNAQRITLSLKNASIETAFSEIRKQSAFRFIYTREELSNTKPVTVELKNASIQEVLMSCFKDQPLSYTIVDQQVIISGKKEDFSAKKTLEISGKVTGEDNQPLAGATVMFKSFGRTTFTNEKGEFLFNNVEPGAVIIITMIGYESRELIIRDDKPLQIALKLLVSELESVSVSTGYQVLPKERVTGSFEKVDNQLFNRSITTNVLERLENIVPGLLFNKKIGTPNSTSISIRGISTLESDQRPLIVLDNFPYEGDINNLNPNDIESITVLKDAPAASIWGSRAGNGVIVITTKKGKYNQRPSVSVNSNATWIEEPELNYIPKFPAKDFIEVESFLFNQGFYNGDLNNRTSYPVISPAVEIFNKRRSGLISVTDSAAQINALLGNDIQKDYSKYLYREALNLQLAASISGGGSNTNYLVSLGYDKNLANLVGNENQRITIRFSNDFRIGKKLDLQFGAILSQQFAETNSPGGEIAAGGGKSALYPYAKLADEGGNPLAVEKNYRMSFLDTVGGGRMLDWKYRPLAELALADNRTTGFDALLNAGVKYQVNTWLSAEGKYQYQKGFSQIENYSGSLTYSTRSLINTFTPRGLSTTNSAVPNSGILRKTNGELVAHAVRGQLNVNKNWKNEHEVVAIVGAEIRETNNVQEFETTYGYDKDLLTRQNVDLINLKPTYFGASTRITNNASYNDKTNRFVSFYGNAAYSFKRRYSITLSGRQDASNLFGTTTNNKWKPLYSGGLAWTISKEPFFQYKLFDFLKLRATYGYSGNVNNTIPAILTIVSTTPNADTRLPAYNINNPPNKSLRWEKSRIVNISMDFSILANRIQGSMEFYTKRSVDLISPVSGDITNGFNNVIMNSAILAGRGIDINITTLNFRKSKFAWNTNLIFSYNTNKTDKYLFVRKITDYLSVDITPIEGRRAYSVISYQWGGLDPNTGRPLGVLDGNISNAYTAIFNQSTEDNLIFHGSSRPEYFGALRNSFIYGKASLSFNISYKLGYYFRRPNPISYSSLYSVWEQTAYTDYQNRWKSKGDENRTNVPAATYPADQNSDNFYRYAEVNVQKGDHFRFQDINFSYSFDRSNFKKSPFESIRVYGYVNNLGLIWKANNAGLDPDYGTPPPISFAAGISINY